MSPPALSEQHPQRLRWLVALPLIGFMAVAALFLLRLYGGDPSRIPSALIGRPDRSGAKRSEGRPRDHL